MIDYIILTAYSPFAVIMQLHPGWVGFMQTKVLNCLGCLWFNRTEVSAQNNCMQRTLISTLSEPHACSDEHNRQRRAAAG